MTGKSGAAAPAGAPTDAPAPVATPVRVRFAPSPTGSLHLGNALTAVANRRFADEHGGVLVLRIDDTDSARRVEGGEEGILRDLAWLGVGCDVGPVRQSVRGEIYRVAATRLVAAGAAVPEADGSVRVSGAAARAAGASAAHRPTLVRPDGSATYHLASVADDADLRITHVIRGADHRSNAELHLALLAALGVPAPEIVHHGLILGGDGSKLSKRDAAGGGAAVAAATPPAADLVSIADFRAAGIPAEAVRAYLEELGLPRHDVRLDLPRVRRLAVEALAALSDEELAARVDAPLRLVAALRGARTALSPVRCSRCRPPAFAGQFFCSTTAASHQAQILASKKRSFFLRNLVVRGLESAGRLLGARVGAPLGSHKARCAAVRRRHRLRRGAA